MQYPYSPQAPLNKSIAFYKHHIFTNNTIFVKTHTILILTIPQNYWQNVLFKTHSICSTHPQVWGILFFLGGLPFPHLSPGSDEVLYTITF